jgi:hypothetical protein
MIKNNTENLLRSRRNFLKNFAYGAAGVTAAATLAGCGISAGALRNYSKALETKNGLVVGFHGFLSDNLDAPLRRSARAVGAQDYISWGKVSDAVKVAEVAYGQQRPIAGIGYSMGRWPLEEFIEKCDRKGIPVELGVVIDGVDPSPIRKIGDNLKRMVQIWGDNSTNFYPARGRIYVPGDFENSSKTDCPDPIIISNCGHLSMPREAEPYITSELGRAFA